MDINKIKQNIDSEIELHFYNEIDSTNTVAKTFAKSGSKAGTAVLSNSQTAGRGRMGKDFYSPEGKGIYVSLIIHPKDTALITIAASQAVCNTIEKLYKIRPQIKWINDILLYDKKICGILAEGGDGYAVIGVGINVSQCADDFPNELQEKAASIEMQTNKQVPLEELAAQLINELWTIFKGNRFLSKKEELLSSYKKDLCMLDRMITIITGAEKIPVYAFDIDENGALIARLKNGETKTFHSGEISTEL